MLKIISKISHNLRFMLALSVTTCMAAAAEPALEIVLNSQPGIYLQELNAFKNLPEYQIVFDEDANSGLKNIRRDLENYNHLTFLQKWIHLSLLGVDSIVVTDQTMPKLHNYVAEICASHNIKLPTIFITQNKGFLNAFAQNYGAIVIGQKMIMTVSDAELEAIIAHELGHIKHHHAGKTTLISLAVGISAYYASKKLIFRYLPEVNPINKSIAAQYTTLAVTNICVPLIINKRFEKQADEFAYKSMNKGVGLVDFFERTENIDQARDAEFSTVKTAIAANSAKLSMYDEYELKLRYYMAVAGYKFNKTYRWIYYNTPYGAHPSPQARIRAVKNYLFSRAAENVEAV